MRSRLLQPNAESPHCRAAFIDLARTCLELYGEGGHSLTQGGPARGWARGRSRRRRTEAAAGSGGHRRLRALHPTFPPILRMLRCFTALALCGQVLLIRRNPGVADHVAVINRRRISAVRFGYAPSGRQEWTTLTSG